MYAVIKSGGKQYKVADNDILKLEKIEGEVGKTVKLTTVLALGTEKGVTVGEPVVKDAVVSAEILEQKKDNKVIVFKKKRRHNYRRKNGHRQQVTVLRILDTSGKGGPGKKIEKPKKVEAKDVKEAAKAAKKTENAKKAEASNEKIEKNTNKKD